MNTYLTSDVKDVLSVISGVIFIFGFVPYIASMLKGVEKPFKATWIIWVGLDIITFVGAYIKHAANGMLAAAVVGGVITIGFVMKYGNPGWTKLEKRCLGGAVLALALWAISGDANVGIFMSLLTTFVGSFPTFKWAWEHPELNSKTSWSIFWVSCLFAFAAIPAWTLADAGPTIVFLLIQSIMVFLIYVEYRIKFDGSCKMRLVPIGI